MEPMSNNPYASPAVPSSNVRRTGVRQRPSVAWLSVAGAYLTLLVPMFWYKAYMYFGQRLENAIKEYLRYDFLFALIMLFAIIIGLLLCSMSFRYGTLVHRLLVVVPGGIHAFLLTAASWGLFMRFLTG